MIFFKKFCLRSLLNFQKATNEEINHLEKKLSQAERARDLAQLERKFVSNRLLISDYLCGAVQLSNSVH